MRRRAASGAGGRFGDARARQWRQRLHARFDSGRGCFADLVVSHDDVAERVDRTAIEPGHVVVQDRGYARVRDVAAVRAAKADFITRIGWNALRLIGHDGERLDPLQGLPSTFEPVERSVRIEGVPCALRLVIVRLPPEGRAAAQTGRAPGQQEQQPA